MIPQQNQNSKEWWEGRYQKSDSDLFSQEPSPFILDFYKLFSVDRPKIVDLACGAGRNSVALAAKGAEVIGMDFSSTAIEAAKKFAEQSQVSVDFQTKDLDFFLPELMSYDGIICVDFKPPPTLVKNLVRGLRKDGYLFIESFLTTACNQGRDLEVFECFRPGELWKEFSGPASNYQVVFYSERGPSEWGQKVHLIVQKTEML